MKNPFVRNVIALVLLTALCTSAGAADQSAIRIGGTGGALGSIREVAAAFQKRHPGITTIVLPSLGSGGGIKAVLSNAIDIALSSRHLSQDERMQGAAEQEYGRTPFIFITSKDVPAPHLTIRQLAAIYFGELRTWPGGLPIRLVLRPKGDTDNDYLRALSPAMDRAVRAALSREGMVTAVTDQENVDLIQRISGAFGASTLSQVVSERRMVSIVRLKGVLPDADALRSGLYPYYKSCYAITAPRTSGPARAFIDFLNSPEGRAILRKNEIVTGPFSSEPGPRGKP